MIMQMELMGMLMIMTSNDKKAWIPCYERAEINKN